MIIYNVYSFIVFILVFIITYFTGFINPEIGKLGNAYFWIITFVISGISEILKIRARLYFLPLWLISLILAILLSDNHFLENEKYIQYSIILVLLVLGFIIMKVNAKKSWQKAKTSLLELNNNNNWDDIKTAFFIPEYLYPNSGFQYMLLGKIYRPMYLKWISKDEVNKHFIEVCKVLKSEISETEYNRYVSLFENKLHKVAKGEKTSFEQHMFENIINLIEKHSK